MNVSIKSLKSDSNLINDVQKFLFFQIEKEFGYGYIPEFHKDIKNLKDFYVYPKRNNFFFATNELDEIIATIGIRAYDKNFDEFKGVYSKEKTASIWRLFVDERYRRCGIASRMFQITEEFVLQNQYDEIYLHTHKNLDGAIDFWKKMGFKVTVDTNNNLQTVHMDKNIANQIISGQLACSPMRYNHNSYVLLI